MSCIPPPPVSGRVNAIKSQFENLSNLESLDISEKNLKNVKKSTKYQFQRAVTSLDLLKRSDKAKNCIKTWTKDDLPKQTSDSALLLKNRKKSKPENSTKTKEIKKKIDVKLQRHTSDPVKRSSIKRSPAFRIGDKQNKAVLLKQSTIQPKEFDDTKFENFLLKNVTNFSNLQQSGLTDSIKVALRQPLPLGPPPKKPPRTFGSPNSDENPIQLFENEQLKQQKCKNPDEQQQQENHIKKKINFLETNLIMKNHCKPISLQKSKTELVLQQQNSKFLDCLSCHKNIQGVYDSVDICDTEKRPLLLRNRSDSYLDQRFPKSNNPSEHIYMEPFSHLKPLQTLTTTGGSGGGGVGCSSIIEESKEFESMSDIGSVASSLNNCNCPENHQKGDLHYLCTAIDESLGDTDSNPDKEGKLSLGKTYDEINILVNAAFQQKSSDSDNNSMGSRSNEDIDNKTSIKLTRSLTEKRKDYVRRVSCVVPDSQKSQNYGTLHRTFKSSTFKTFSFDTNDNNKFINDDRNTNTTKNDGDNLQNANELENIITTSERIDKYKKLIETNNSNISNINYRNKKPQQPTTTTTNDNDDDLDTDLVDLISNDDTNLINTQKLFQVCMLIGFNTSTNRAYIKLKYPPNEPVPDNIEQLVFPSKNLIKSGRDNQDYYLILTDDNGFKVYGYCRRIIPENSEICLPLAYCIISITKTIGFYQKILKEIEQRHGQSETQLNFLLNKLYNSEIPNPGKFLHIKLPISIRPKTFFSSTTSSASVNHKHSPKRLSLETNPKWLIDSGTQFSLDNNILDNERKKTIAIGLKNIQEYDDNKSHQETTSSKIDFDLINRSLIVRDPRFDEILIRRPNDIRLENTELSDLLLTLGSELLISIFATLLLERKVILQSKNISILSKSILALQSILYPFQWQYTIVTILPHNLIEICQAPFPVLAGILESISFEIEDGIVIDLDYKQIKQCCGDEQTIIPETLQNSLQLSLEMVDFIDKGKMLSSVLISEAFLRFFIELFGDYKQTKKNYFHKDEFIQSNKSQNVKFFLEWFIETSMFRHFCNTKYLDNPEDDGYNKFYEIFDARLMEKSENKTKTTQNIETIMKNSKIINNKKGKTFKERFKIIFSK